MSLSRSRPGFESRIGNINIFFAWLNAIECNSPSPLSSSSTLFELELVQSHMAQKPVLRGEVGCACVALFFFL